MLSRQICMYVYLYAVNPKKLPYIFLSIIRAMENNYMQKDFISYYIFPGNLLEWNNCVKVLQFP